MIKKQETTPVKVVNKYSEGRGGRKTATARVRLVDNISGITVNDKDYKQYFRLPRQQMVVEAPLKIVNFELDKMGVSAKVRGGGSTGQAEAVRLGIARALLQFNIELKKKLREAGFLTRDARIKERKKYGQKGARKRFQFSKR